MRYDFESFILEDEPVKPVRRKNSNGLVRHAIVHEKLAREALRCLQHGTRTLPTNSKRDDPEIGFIPAIAAAIPMVANLAGSLLGGGGKDGKGDSGAASKAQDVLGILTNAIGGDKNQGEDSIKEVVANIVRTIPSPVMNEVKNAIKQMKDADKADAQARDLVVKGVDSKFGPHIHALLAGLKASQLQAQATHEHNTIKAENAFRTNTVEVLREIGSRLVNLEKRLNTSAIVKGDARINILGGRSMLERG